MGQLFAIREVENLLVQPCFAFGHGTVTASTTLSIILHRLILIGKVQERNFLLSLAQQAEHDTKKEDTVTFIIITKVVRVLLNIITKVVTSLT